MLLDKGQIKTSASNVDVPIPGEGDERYEGGVMWIEDPSGRNVAGEQAPLMV